MKRRHFRGMWGFCIMGCDGLIWYELMTFALVLQFVWSDSDALVHRILQHASAFFVDGV